MSLLLRSLLREPALVEAATRPVSRAMRRYDDPFVHDPWSVAVLPQVLDAVNRINDFAHEIDQLAGHHSRAGGDMVMKRASDGTMQLAVDVTHYKPENIKINVVDNHLVVEARNESNEENSYRKSEFKQWFKLPKDCKLEEIKSNLTADNRLLISLPSNKPAVEQKMRSIPITIDKPAAVDQQKKSDSQ